MPHPTQPRRSRPDRSTSIIPLLRAARAYRLLAAERVAKRLRLSNQLATVRGAGASEPVSIGAMQRLEEIDTALAAALSELTGETITDAAAGLARALQLPGGAAKALQRHQDGQDVLYQIRDAARQYERLADRPPETLYVGLCDNLPGGRPCNTGVYARPGATVATCTHCGHQIDVHERRQYLIERAHRMALPARQIADALCTPEFGNLTVTTKDIYNWAARGRITVRGTNMRGDRLYNLGEVITHALARHA